MLYFRRDQICACPLPWSGQEETPDVAQIVIIPQNYILKMSGMEGLMEIDLTEPTVITAAAEAAQEPNCQGEMLTFQVWLHSPTPTGEALHPSNSFLLCSRWTKLVSMTAIKMHDIIFYFLSI